METSPAWPPPRRDCDHCGDVYQPKATRQRFCSAKCRERGKYVELRSDPEKWSAYLARTRAKYEPTGRPPGVPPTHIGCTVDGCDAKHLARGFCRKHYYRDRYRRGLDRRQDPQTVGATLKHYDESGFIEEAAPVNLLCYVSPALLIPECPDCGRIMKAVPTSTDLDLRDCADCQVRVSLNVEEVSWLISEKLSTKQQPPTLNSSETSTLL